MSAIINQPKHLSTLPSEIIKLIFSFLDAAPLRTCTKVCTEFKKIILAGEFLRPWASKAGLQKNILLNTWLIKCIHSKDDVLKFVKPIIAKANPDKKLKIYIYSLTGDLIHLELHKKLDYFDEDFSQEEADVKEFKWMDNGVMPNKPYGMSIWASNFRVSTSEENEVKKIDIASNAETAIDALDQALSI